MISFKPIYKSESGNIVGMKYNDGCGALFAFTDLGKIVKIKEINEDYMGRGLTHIFSQSHNGEGDFLPVVFDTCYYDLYKSVISINSSDKIFTYIDSDVLSFSAISYSKIKALYISDILKADEDFGFWKEISWTQTSLISRVVVGLKVANTEAELLSMDWQYYISKEPPEDYNQSISNIFNVVESLNRFNLKGRFMMFKVELETTSLFDNPIVSNFVISYAAKHAVFFFTRKIKISKDSNVDNIIITASYSTPEKTEVKFGIADNNSADWEDYKLIELDRLASLPSDYSNSIKLGIKLSSYSETRYPVVQEFGFILGSESDNLLND